MSDWLPSLNALRAFESVTRHLNYRVAADELNVSPAAVKQLVSKLEAALGSPLVERKGRGLALTAQGTAGRDDLSKAFRQIKVSVEKMRLVDQRQRLIVSVEPSFATAWLVPRLELFRNRNAHIDVLIDSSLQLVDLEHGAADIAIRFGGKAAPGLIAQRLFDEELCAYCSPLLTSGRSGLKRLEDLERVTLLHWDLSQLEWASATKKWMGWKQWLSFVGASHITPGVGLRFGDYNLALQAAIAGQGVVLGSTPILRSLVDAKLLVNPFPLKVTTDIGYDLVTTERARARPEVTSFIDWITNEASS
jgi:LysR family transcriptional regulator, glycine cleavage system transcriptional activator